MGNRIQWLSVELLQISSYKGNLINVYESNNQLQPIFIKSISIRGFRGFLLADLSQWVWPSHTLLIFWWGGGDTQGKDCSCYTTIKKTFEVQGTYHNFCTLNLFKGLQFVLDNLTSALNDKHEYSGLDLFSL